MLFYVVTIFPYKALYYHACQISSKANNWYNSLIDVLGILPSVFIMDLLPFGVDDVHQETKEKRNVLVLDSDVYLEME